MRVVDQAASLEMRYRIGRQLHEFGRAHVAFLVMDACAHVTDGIDSKDRQMIPIDVYADREEGVGIDLELNCRLAPQPMPAASLNDQSLVKQAINDPGD